MKKLCDEEEVLAAFPPPSSPTIRRDDCHGGFRACERKREKRVEGERVASESDHREGSIEIQRRERPSFFLFHTCYGDSELLFRKRR